MCSNPVAGGAPTSAITDTILCVPAVTLSTKKKAKLIEQVKLGFKKKNKLNEISIKNKKVNKNFKFGLFV